MLFSNIWVHQDRLIYENFKAHGKINGKLQGLTLRISVTWLGQVSSDFTMLFAMSLACGRTTSGCTFMSSINVIKAFACPTFNSVKICCKLLDGWLICKWLDESGYWNPTAFTMRGTILETMSLWPSESGEESNRMKKRTLSVITLNDRQPGSNVELFDADVPSNSSCWVPSIAFVALCSKSWYTYSSSQAPTSNLRKCRFVYLS